MIESLIVQNSDNQKLQLYPTDKFILTETKGMGAADATINSAKVGILNGERFNSSTLNKRNITMKVVPRHDTEEGRALIYQYLQPGENCRVYVKTTSRNAYIDGYVEKAEPDVFSNVNEVGISIICPDPDFIADASFETLFSTTAPAFHFAFSIDSDGIPFSTLEKTTNQTIVNAGDTSTGVTIHLEASGAVSNPVIYDEATGEFMKLNLDLAENEYIDINTQIGQKKINYVSGGFQISGLPYLAPGSSWLRLKPGQNAMYYNCDSGLDNLSVTVSHKVRYRGV